MQHRDQSSDTRVRVGTTTLRVLVLPNSYFLTRASYFTRLFLTRRLQRSLAASCPFGFEYEIELRPLLRQRRAVECRARVHGTRDPAPSRASRHGTRASVETGADWSRVWSVQACRHQGILVYIYAHKSHTRYVIYIYPNHVRRCRLWRALADERERGRLRLSDAQSTGVGGRTAQALKAVLGRRFTRAVAHIGRRWHVHCTRSRWHDAGQAV